MAGMMNQMGAAMGGQMQGVTAPGMPGQPTPPPAPGVNVSFMVAVNGQQYGPYNMQQLQQMQQNGQFNHNTHVWRQGMANWEVAGNVPELAVLFAPAAPGTPPPPPGVPPMP